MPISLTIREQKKPGVWLADGVLHTATAQFPMQLLLKETAEGLLPWVEDEVMVNLVQGKRLLHVHPPIAYPIPAQEGQQFEIPRLNLMLEK